jgi:hypothetical protein
MGSKTDEKKTETKEEKREGPRKNEKERGKGGGRRTNPPPLGQPQWAAGSLTEEGKGFYV